MKRALTVSLISAALAAAQGQAPQQAQPQTLAGVVRLNRIPVSNEVLKVKLPRPVERQLPNGMKLLVVESHRRHSRDDLAGRVQPFAHSRPPRLLHSARLGLLLDFGTRGNVHDADRAVEPDRDQRRRSSSE